jgi:chromosome segregation ATPase
VILRALPLAALALAAGLCAGEDPVVVLERQKQEILATTVEKKAFWAEVERKGAAAKRLRELEDERAGLVGELGDLGARRASVDPAVAQAEEVNSRAEAVKEEIGGREAELRKKIAELESVLSGWKAASSPGGRGGAG